MHNNNTNNICYKYILGWGSFKIVTSSGNVVALKYEPVDDNQQLFGFMEEELANPATTSDTPCQIADQLEEYFYRERCFFYFRSGTRIAEPLSLILKYSLTIPYGYRITSRQLAYDINRPDLEKNIQKLITSNPLPLLYPCHRIVENEHSIGLHAWGRKMKRRLLDFEFTNR